LFAVTSRWTQRRTDSCRCFRNVFETRLKNYSTEKNSPHSYDVHRVYNPIKTYTMYHFILIINLRISALKLGPDFRNILSIVLIQLHYNIGSIKSHRACTVFLKIKQKPDMFRCGTGQQVDRDGGLDSSDTGGWRR
jgi:hypothetical protein